MHIHKHLIKGYLNAVKIMRTHIMTYETTYKKKSQIIHRDHFVKESEHFLKEIMLIHKQNSQEENELSKIKIHLPKENLDYYKESISNLDQYISSLIHLVPEINRPLNTTMSVYNSRYFSEIDNNIVKIEHLLGLIIANSEGMAKMISQNAIVIEEEIKWLETERSTVKTIRHNINSWFV